MSDSQQRPRGLGAAARVTALAGSVMDLHVKIALQEMDREKRRLISGGVFLAMGGGLILFTFLALQIAGMLWIKKSFNWSWESTLVMTALIDITLAGLSLRIGGQLAKGPYLPETLEGISRTTKAVLGKS